MDTSFGNVDDLNRIDELKFQEHYWIDKFNFVKIYNELNRYPSVNKECSMVVKLLLFFNYLKNYPLINESSIGPYIEEVIDLFTNFFSSQPTIRQVECNNNIPIKSFNNPNDLYCIKYTVGSYASSFFIPIIDYNNNNSGSQYYSDRHKTNGIKIFTSFDITSGTINFLSKDVYKGSKEELDIAVESGFCSTFKLKENERVLGDFGFLQKGDTFICTNVIGSGINNSSSINISSGSIDGSSSSGCIKSNEEMGGYEITTPIDKAKKSLQILQHLREKDLNRFQRMFSIIVNLVNFVNTSNGGGEPIIKSKQVILKGGRSNELLEPGILNNPITACRRELTSKVGPRFQNMYKEIQLSNAPASMYFDQEQSKLVFKTVPNSIIAITQVVKTLPSYLTEVYVPPEDPFCKAIETTNNNNNSLHYINNFNNNNNNNSNNNNNNNRFTILTTDTMCISNSTTKGIPMDSITTKVSKTSLISSSNSYFKLPSQSSGRTIQLPSHIKDQRKFLRSAQNNLTFI